MSDLREKFLFDTDQTGRFIVESKATGVKYYVEPIGSSHVKWGDQDPVSKKLTGKYGQKYKGSIEAEDSLITDDNGFENIVTLEPGQSPLAYINKIDEGKLCSS